MLQTRVLIVLKARLISLKASQEAWFFTTVVIVAGTWNLLMSVSNLKVQKCLPFVSETSEVLRESNYWTQLLSGQSLILEELKLNWLSRKRSSKTQCFNKYLLSSSLLQTNSVMTASKVTLLTPGIVRCKSDRELIIKEHSCTLSRLFWDTMHMKGHLVLLKNNRVLISTTKVIRMLKGLSISFTSTSLPRRSRQGSWSQQMSKTVKLSTNAPTL